MLLQFNDREVAELKGLLEVLVPEDKYSELLKSVKEKLNFELLPQYTPEKFILFWNQLHDLRSELKDLEHEAYKRVVIPAPALLRPAHAEDIVEGRILYYDHGELYYEMKYPERWTWTVVDEVIEPGAFVDWLSCSYYITPNTPRVYWWMER